MPLYSYYCLCCKVEFDEVKSFKDSDALMPCPTCKSMCNRVIRIDTNTIRFSGKLAESNTPFAGYR